MNDVTFVQFDYTGLPEIERDLAKAAAERIRTRMRRTVQDVIEIGRDLIAIKGKIGHGQFLNWIGAEFDMHESSARRFMLVGERYGKSFNLKDLKLSTIYELAATDTPDAVREEVEARVASGEHISIEEVKRLKDEWAAERKDLKQQIDAVGVKVRDAKSTQADYGQQITDLQREIVSLRGERDTLRFELERRERAPSTPALAGHITNSIDSLDGQVEALLNDWNRVSEKARAEFLRRVGLPSMGAAA